MTKLFFRTAFAVIILFLFACSSDDSATIDDGNPTNPASPIRISVTVEQGNYPINHIKIFKVVNGQDVQINEMASNGSETAPWAHVEAGNRIRVRYAIGIAEPLTLKYHIVQGNQELNSESATIQNHDAAFAEFFNITVTVE
jgi:hypothetical protein